MKKEEYKIVDDEQSELQDEQAQAVLNEIAKRLEKMTDKGLKQNKVFAEVHDLRLGVDDNNYEFIEFREENHLFGGIVEMGARARAYANKATQDGHYEIDQRFHYKAFIETINEFFVQNGAFNYVTDQMQGLYNFMKRKEDKTQEYQIYASPTMELRFEKETSKSIPKVYTDLYQNDQCLLKGVDFVNIEKAVEPFNKVDFKVLEFN